MHKQMSVDPMTSRPMTTTGIILGLEFHQSQQNLLNSFKSVKNIVLDCILLSTESVF